MIAFTWLLFVTSTQVEQLFDVFLSSFLPQDRFNTEELSDYFNKKIVPRLEKGQLIYVALNKEQIVGFVIFEKWEGKSYYLAEMAILPKYQRQGLGKKLVFSILSKDPSADKILLITEIANKSAQCFYEKIGFKHSSFQHPDYPENFTGYEY